MDKENMRIDFKDLLRSIAKHFKKIICILIIGFVIGGGLCFGLGRNKVSVTPTNAELTAEANNYKNELTDQQASDIYDNYQTYSRLKSLKQQIMALSNNSASFLNNLQSSGKQMTNVYSVSANDKASSIIYAYQSLIMNDNVYDSIRKVMGQTYTNDMIDQFVIIESSLDSDDNSVSVNVNANNSESLKITTLGENENKCKQIMTIVQKRINALRNSMAKKYGSFQLISAGSNTTSINRDNIVKIKQSYTKQIDSLSASMKSITDSITDADQLNYFNALLKISNNNKAVYVTSKKNIVLFTAGGGFGLAILYVIILIAAYLCSSKLHTSDNFKQLFHVDILADPDHANKQIIDQELQLFSENHEGRTLLVSTDQSLIDDLKVSDHFVTMSGIPDSAEDYKKIQECRQLILFEKINSSKLNEIADVISYYKDHHIKAQGAVITK